MAVSDRGEVSLSAQTKKRKKGASACMGGGGGIGGKRRVREVRKRGKSVSSRTLRVGGALELGAGKKPLGQKKRR